MQTPFPLPQHITAGLSSGAIDNLGNIAARVQQLQQQGLPQNQIAAVIQNELTTTPNMIPLANSYALFNYLKSHPATVQAPDPDSVAVSMAKQIAAQDQQKKAAQAQRAAAMQQPQSQQAPSMAPPAQPQMTGVAGLPTGNLGQHFATGGIVAFDEGGNIQSQQIAARMAAGQQPAQAQGLASLPAYLTSAETNQGDVDFAAAHGGPVKHYDGTDGSVVSNDNTTATSNTYGGIAPLQIFNPNTGKINASALTNLAFNLANVNNNPKSFSDTIAEKEKKLGIGQGWDRFLAIHGESLNDAQNEFNKSSQLADQAGAAAGIKQASLLGNQAGYAGTGLSGLIASVGANAAARTAAKAEAVKELAKTKLELAKIEAEGTLNHEMALQKNLRTDATYDYNMEKDRTANIQHAISTAVNLGKIQSEENLANSNQALRASMENPLNVAQRQIYNSFIEQHKNDESYKNNPTLLQQDAEKAMVINGTQMQAIIQKQVAAEMKAKEDFEKDPLNGRIKKDLTSDDPKKRAKAQADYNAAIGRLIGQYGGDPNSQYVPSYNPAVTTTTMPPAGAKITPYQAP